jgi:hypothetical protein
MKGNIENALGHSIIIEFEHPKIMEVDARVLVFGEDLHKACGMTQSGARGNKKSRPV